MILNEQQVKLVADRGRALPDAVLAPLVLAVVLEHAASPLMVVSTPESQPATTPWRPEAPRGPYLGAQKRADIVVDYVSKHPGVSCSAIAKGIDCHPNTVRDAVKRAGARLTRHGTGNDTKYYVAAASEPKPAVLLTEQRVDGENKQKLVQVVRRRAPKAAELPRTAMERRVAISEFVRANPGTRSGDLIKRIGCTYPQFRYAVQPLLDDGTLRMEGERSEARYYVRGYVNGAASAVTA